jgi:hypothetical protein
MFIGDIGAVIGPADYNKVEADDYILHEDGEKIFFLIKSKSDEYCFTNLALLHLDGASAASKGPSALASTRGSRGPGLDSRAAARSTS